VLVRPPESSFVAALGQRPDAPPIDVDLALAQHELLVAALQAAGLRVVRLPSCDGLPDACFVQDTALVLPDVVILGRPALPARQGEVAAIRPHLPDDRPLVEVQAPGTLEWGDVLRIDDTLFVGLSERSNAAGAEQVRAALAPFGLHVETIAAVQGLHLLSGLSYVGPPPGQADGPGVALAWPVYLDLPQLAGLDVITVPKEEAPAANALAHDGTVILRAGFARTAAQLWQRGFRVLSVPLSEFGKADGGVTCLSLLL
jgi:dimethylargininase